MFELYTDASPQRAARLRQHCSERFGLAIRDRRVRRLGTVKRRIGEEAATKLALAAIRSFEMLEQRWRYAPRPLPRALRGESRWVLEAMRRVAPHLLEAGYRGHALREYARRFALHGGGDPAAWTAWLRRRAHEQV